MINAVQLSDLTIKICYLILSVDQELRSGPSWTVLAEGLMMLQPRSHLGLQTSEELSEARGSASHSQGWQLLVVGGQEVRPPFHPLEASPTRLFEYSHHHIVVGQVFPERKNTFMT